MSVKNLFHELVGKELEYSQLTDAQKASVDSVLANLSPRLEKVLRQFFGLGIKKSKVEDIANELGISKKHVYTLRNKGIEELKHVHNLVVLETILGINRHGGKDNYPDFNSCGLSARAKNPLIKAGIYTLSEIAQKSERQLLRLQGFGHKSLVEVKELLARYGLRLNEDI